MSEFDIRIGTQLDTKTAEAQLKDFIKKYKDSTPLSFDLKVNGTENLTALEKTLKNIKSLTKDIGNINVNVGNSIGNVKTNVSNDMQKEIQSLINTTNSVTKQLGEGTSKSISLTTKQLDKSLDKTKKQVESMVNGLEKIKTANLLGDSKDLDKILIGLKQIQSTDLSKFGNLGLNMAREEIESVIGKYNELVNTAKNNAWQEGFNNIKLNPMLEQMNAVKIVAESLGKDTSGIDTLISDMIKLNSSTTDTKATLDSFKDISTKFNNLKMSIDTKSVKSAEAGIKLLLGYKEELNRQITMNIDSSKVAKAKEEIKLIDSGIQKLQSGLDKVGKSNNLNLTNSSNKKQIEDVNTAMEKQLKTFETLKKKAEQVKNTDFIDISKMTAMDACIKGVQQSIDMIDMNKLTSTDVSNVTSQMNLLDNTIKAVSADSANIKLQAKFDTDFENVATKLNGIHAEMIRLGQDTSEVERLKSSLDSLKNLSLNDSISGLASISREMKNLSNVNGFKGLDGSIKQFKSLTNEANNLKKALASTSNSNIASGIEGQLNRTNNAIKQLTSGFSKAKQEYSNMFSGGGGGTPPNDFTKQINSALTAIGKLRTEAGNISKIMGSGFKSNVGQQFTQEFTQACSKLTELESKLKSLKIKPNVDASEISKVQQEIEKVRQSMSTMRETSIAIKATESIAELNQLKQQLQSLGKSTSNVDGLINEFNRLGQEFSEGKMNLDQYSNAMQNLFRQAGNMTAPIDAIGRAGMKVEGFFKTLSNSFSQVGLGMMISRAVTSAVGGIKSAITELDASLVDVSRVLPDNVSASSANLQKIASDAKSIAIEVGQSTEDVIKGMATSLRAGANTMEQATAIARSSAIFQNVTDMTAESASQSVASLISQYYSMDTALNQVSSGAGKTVKDYNNLTEAMDMVNYAG